MYIFAPAERIKKQLSVQKMQLSGKNQQLGTQKN